jgi:hypothetical protein
MNCLQIALNAILKFLSSEDERCEDFIRKSCPGTGNKVRIFPTGDNCIRCAVNL